VALAMRRRRWLWLARGLAVAASLFLFCPSSRADAVAKLVDALNGARSYKVRIQAAALLGRLRDARAGQALVRSAASDSSPLVREIAVKLIAHSPAGERLPAGSVRQALKQALSDDDSGVRRQAAASLAELQRSAGAHAARPVRTGPIVVAVGSVGDRTGRASRALRERMRAQMRGLLQRQSGLQLAELGAGDVVFLVDGSISKLTMSLGGPDVEAACAVDLVVSRPPRGIVTVASGEAIVQKPRRYYQPVLRERMEEEAMDNAVRGAHETLAQFLATQ
jgi:hypothetical protein